jgi:hypothetical protein
MCQMIEILTCYVCLGTLYGFSSTLDEYELGITQKGKEERVGFEPYNSSR